VGTPHCSAFAITSANPQVNVFVLADLMEEKGKLYELRICLLVYLCFMIGWKLERAQKSLHFTILPSHTIESSNHLLADLKSCIITAKVSHPNCDIIIFGIQI